MTMDEPRDGGGAGVGGWRRISMMLGAVPWRAIGGLLASVRRWLCYGALAALFVLPTLFVLWLIAEEEFRDPSKAAATLWVAWSWLIFGSTLTLLYAGARILGGLVGAACFGRSIWPRILAAF